MQQTDAFRFAAAQPGPRWLAAGGALALALGGSLLAVPAFASSEAGRGEAAKAEAAQAAALGGAVSAAEAAVTSAPREAALRAALGRAYFRAGRFESAAAAYGDALTLGDASGRTALSLALSDVAIGRKGEAVQVLDGARGEIGVADFGLAMALAGETGRGVAVLVDAVRSGQGTLQLRQNLAYAYALDGRWEDARVMALLDVPADQVDERMTQWARTTRDDAFRARVASLLGVPLRGDNGMPAQLALAPAPVGQPAPQMALAPTPAPAPAPVAAPAQELPPVNEAPAAAPDDLRRAEAAPAVPAYRPPVFHPVVAEAAPAPRVLAHGMAPARAAVPHGARKPASAGSHVVQLGAFASAENAEKARRQFMAHGAFAGHSIEVARAEVNGRAFWRVSARGYDAASAQGACGALKRHGAVCLARADLGGAQHAAALHGHGTPDLAFADRR